MSFEVFNVIEAIFWLGCALISLGTMRMVRILPRTFWSLLALVFFLFGVSDMAEVVYGESFLLPGGKWLLIWKGACVAGLVVLLGYYFWKRLSSMSK